MKCEKCGKEIECGCKPDYRIRFVVPKTDDGYIIAGTSESFGDNLLEGYIVKVDSEGELEWEETYGGASDDNLESIALFPDAGYLGAGYTLSTGTGESDVWLFSVSPDGNFIELIGPSKTSLEKPKEEKASE